VRGFFESLGQPLKPRSSTEESLSFAATEVEAILARAKVEHYAVEEIDTMATTPPDKGLPSLRDVAPVLDEIARMRGDVAAMAQEIGSSAQVRRRNLKTEFAAPRTMREKRLAAIYSTVLSVDSVGVYDSFFELGGNSLLVFKLIAACEQEFGLRLSVQDVYSTPSVSELGVLIDSAGIAMDTCLVPLKPKQGAPLLLFIHAAGGSALPFIRLAHHLAEFSTYALQAPGVDDDNLPLPSVEAYAAHYVTVVDQIRGYSPVLVAGWSFGGNIALEMSRLWKERGMEVAATLLLDSWVAAGHVTEGRPLAAHPTAEAHSASTADGAADSTAAAAGSAAAAAEVVRGIAQYLEAEALAQLEGAAAAEVTAEARARLRRVIDAHRRAFRRYEPQWFDAEIELLRAVEPFPAGAGVVPASYLLEDRGWARYVREVRVHEVRGHHFNLVSGENAASLAKTIREIADLSLLSSAI
jgi:thioesterase domain-containing protein/acyl carrier protein